MDDQKPASVPTARPETGAMQFGEDWPGIFIRGDNALSYSIQLAQFIEYPNYPAGKLMLRSLVKLLASCNAIEVTNVQMAKLLVTPEVQRG